MEGAGESGEDLEGEVSVECIVGTFSCRAFAFALHVCSRERTLRIKKTVIVGTGTRFVGQPVKR